MPLWRGVIEEYRDHLPITEATPVITLQEGGTPLVRANALSERTGMEMYLKYEGANPTGSFKDRGMCVAIAKAVEEGAAAVTCGSTGNTSASAAAYAAKAGLRCIVLVPQGGITMASSRKLSSTEPRCSSGRTSMRLSTCLEAGEDPPNNKRELGKSASHRGTEDLRVRDRRQLGRAPDYHVMPVGNAGKSPRSGRIRGIWTDRPVMFGVQAEGAAPFIKGEPIEDPSTLASAIRIGNPASWEGAVKATTESGGEFLAVSDGEILEAYHVLAEEEGLFCEPASAASLAGFIRLIEEDRLERGRTCVLILTGHGLKDPDRALAEAPSTKRVPADLETVAHLLGW